MRKVLSVVLCLMLLFPFALAVSLSGPVTAADQATFDQILTPVLRVYNFVKYAATILMSSSLLRS